MGTNTVDPVTGIVIPTPGQEPGPQYASDVSNALTTLAHLTHTGAANLDGYQIPSAGINFNADISAQSNNLTNLRSTRYSIQTSPLSGVGDLNCLYDVNGNLFFNDGYGNQIQVTSGGQVEVVASNNYATTAINSNTTISSSATTVIYDCDPTSNTILITLPLSSAVPTGRFYIFKDKTGHSYFNNITIQKSGSDNIDGYSSFVINSNYGLLDIYNNGGGSWSARQKYNANFTVVGTAGATQSIVCPPSTNSTITLSADNINITSYDSNIQVSGDMFATAVFGSIIANGLAMHVRDVNTSYAINNTNDVFILVDTAGGAYTITLPIPENGNYCVVKDQTGHAASNHLTVSQNSTEKIDGQNTFVITSNYGVARFINDGVNWSVV